MSSYRQILCHIVFRTKDSLDTIDQEHSRELYYFILGILKHKKCFLYRINGTEYHLHLLCDLHPSLALADFLRDIKTSTSIWLKQSGKFPKFDSWAEGYAALTYSWKDKDKIVNYIKNQQEHHKKLSFIEELRILLQEQGIEINEKYFP